VRAGSHAGQWAAAQTGLANLEAFQPALRPAKISVVGGRWHSLEREGLDRCDLDVGVGGLLDSSNFPKELAWLRGRACGRSCSIPTCWDKGILIFSAFAFSKPSLHAHALSPKPDANSSHDRKYPSLPTYKGSHWRLLLRCQLSAQFCFADSGTETSTPVLCHFALGCRLASWRGSVSLKGGQNVEIGAAILAWEGKGMIGLRAPFLHWEHHTIGGGPSRVFY
jgi:hypothetical protein